MEVVYTAWDIRQMLNRFSNETLEKFVLSDSDAEAILDDLFVRITEYMSEKAIKE